MIPAVIAAGTIIIAIVIFPWIKAVHKTKEASKAEAVESNIVKEKKPIGQEHAEYPQEILLDEGIQQEEFLAMIV